MPRHSCDTIQIAVDAAGGNFTRAATALGIARKDLVRAVGAPERRGRPRTELDPERVRRAVEEEPSQRAAAARLGVPESSLRRFLRRSGGTDGDQEKGAAAPKTA